MGFTSLVSVPLQFFILASWQALAPIVQDFKDGIVEVQISSQLHKMSEVVRGWFDVLKPSSQLGGLWCWAISASLLCQALRTALHEEMPQARLTRNSRMCFSALKLHFKENGSPTRISRSQFNPSVSCLHSATPLDFRLTAFRFKEKTPQFWQHRSGTDESPWFKCGRSLVEQTRAELSWGTWKWSWCCLQLLCCVGCFSIFSFSHVKCLKLFFGCQGWRKHQVESAGRQIIHGSFGGRNRIEGRSLELSLGGGDRSYNWLGLLAGWIWWARKSVCSTIHNLFLTCPQSFVYFFTPDIKLRWTDLLACWKL